MVLMTPRRQLTDTKCRTIILSRSRRLFIIKQVCLVLSKRPGYLTRGPFSIGQSHVISKLVGGDRLRKSPKQFSSSKQNRRQHYPTPATLASSPAARTTTMVISSS